MGSLTNKTSPTSNKKLTWENSPITMVISINHHQPLPSLRHAGLYDICYRWLFLPKENNNGNKDYQLVTYNRKLTNNNNKNTIFHSLNNNQKINNDDEKLCFEDNFVMDYIVRMKSTPFKRMTMLLKDIIHHQEMRNLNILTLNIMTHMIQLGYKIRKLKILTLKMITHMIQMGLFMQVYILEETQHSMRVTLAPYMNGSLTEMIS